LNTAGTLAGLSFSSVVSNWRKEKMKKPKDSRKRKKATFKPYKCAIYARSASEMQTASNSTADQIRMCTEYGEKQGWQIIKESAEADIAVSGASLVKRHALRSLMEAAEKRPRVFDRVLIADMSRLARNVEDFLQVMNHFHNNGVDVMTIREGSIWPNRAQFILRGLMDEQYLFELSRKARAGRAGR
jgi:DNA invertase Pin-like site-specific DNA recombinase